MKKIVIIIFLSFLFIVPAQADNLTQRLSGKVLLQVEDKGQAWYFDPVAKKRAFLGRPSDAFRIMRELGLGVSEYDYQSFAGFAPGKLSGKILLRVESLGEAYYVNPDNLKLYYLGCPSDAFRIMRKLGLGITNLDLNTIAIHNKYKETKELKIQTETTKNLVNLYLFHGEGCPHCAKEEAFLEILTKEFDNIRINKYETWHNEDNRALYQKVKDKYGFNANGVPFLIIGDETVYGFGDNETTGERIRQIVKRQSKEGSRDIVFPILDKVYLVSKVVDGDTIDVVMNGEIKRVRIIGVDTPEVVNPRQAVECFGREASDTAKEILNNQYVRLESDDSQGDIDKYGRLLRHVILENGNNFAELMISKGLAREYTYKTVSKYQTDFILAENEAKNNKTGIWADGACDNYDDNQKAGVVSESFNSSIVISDIFYNGLENPLEGDEYVEIINNGLDINLKNYSLSDESGKLFVFPDFVLRAKDSLKIFTGCGDDTDIELYWCHADSAIWNNSGDTAKLKNNEDLLIASYTY